MEGLTNELKDKTEELNKLKSLLAAKEQGLNKVKLYMAVIHLLYIAVISLSQWTNIIIV